MKKIFAILTIALMGAMSVNAQTNSNAGPVAKKFEVRLDFSYQTNFKSTHGDDSGILSTEEGGIIGAGVGYNIDRNWYVGLATGYIHNMSGVKSQHVPLLGDVTYRYYLPNEKWSLYAEGRAGYLFSATKDDTFLGKKFEYPGAFIMEIQPGVNYHLMPNLDLKAGIGYIHFNPNSNDGGRIGCANYMTIKIGANYRF